MANDRHDGLDPFSSFSAWMQPLSWWNAAPQRLTQPINPGWTFGNLIVSTANSSAPEVEQAVVARHSYGRQLGRITAALEAVAEALPQLAGDARVRGFLKLAHEVDEIKQEAVEQRFERLRREIEELKACAPAQWRELAALFR
jgi:hypothetical protein